MSSIGRDDRSSIAAMLDRQDEISRQKTAVRRPDFRRNPFMAHANGGSVPWQNGPDGPLPESVGTAHLPEYIIGRSRLPKACMHCGNKTYLKDAQSGPKLGGSDISRLICARLSCGRQLGWIVGDITRNISVRVSRPDPVPIDGFAYGEGCTEACDSLKGHSARVHEGYGRMRAAIEASREPSGILRSGRLVINFERRVYAFDGRSVQFTGIMERLLRYLATNAGRPLSAIKICHHLWGEVNHQNLRSQIWRLRKNLRDDDRRMIESVPDGYRFNILEEVSP